MKFTSEDLMKAMGLSVGDRIKIGNKIFEIYISPQNELRCVNIHNSNNHFYFKNLIDKDIDIIPRPKRVGDLKCDDFDGCDYGCPLMWLCCNHRNEEHGCDISLYNVLDFYEIDDQEIHDLLKARLDKVVE